MAQTKNGRSWIERHLNDPFVKKAQKAGYRSRASFKLLELHEQDHLFYPGMKVVDLGAAPGGWSQILVKLVASTSKGKDQGKVIALDILDMAPLGGVHFIQGDFLALETVEKLQASLNESPLDWVISDISPNISGMMAVDQPRIMELADLAWEFARAHLKKGGGFLVKVFQGEGFDGFVRGLRQNFEKVSIRKPNASRSASRELYVLARGYYNI